MIIRVLTYNVHKCIGGLDRKYRPERIVEVIEHHDPHIILLQEVDNNAARSSYHKQVDYLAEHLGLPHRVWAPNVFLRRGGEYGNAIISRFPILESQNINLTIGRRKRRSVLHGKVRVRVGGGVRTIHVYNMHLGLAESERKKQLDLFCQSDPFHRLPQRSPIIVGGDMNDVWGSLGPLYFYPRGFHGRNPVIKTFPSWAPARALDAIYARGDVKIQSIKPSRKRTARFASDHLPLIATLELLPRPKTQKI